MSQQRPERRKQPDEAQGLAELSVRTRIPVDKLPLQRSTDIGRENELRTAVKEKLLAMAGFTAIPSRSSATNEQAETGLRPAVEAKAPTAELSPEQVWFSEFKTRFDALPQLHKGVQWADVDKSLRADPEAMKKLQALDEKGHKMNVFGEEGDEFIFASAWNEYEQVAQDHRNIAYDPEGQKLAEKQGYKPNGNAVSIIAKIIGVGEDEASNYLADPKFHEQLRRAVAINGWAWLKTDAATRGSGDAFLGYYNGTTRSDAAGRIAAGSFRAALRVKKV